MKPFDSSPCHAFGVAPGGAAHPCLEPGWDGRTCPMDRHHADELRACAARMYKLGYPYATWVVRRRWFGLRRECTLEFLRERPAQAAESQPGDGVLHVSPATF